MAQINDDGLRQAFERTVYALKDSGHGNWRGENLAQRLTLEFDSGAIRLIHPDGNVEFHLTGYGYGDRLEKPAAAMLAPKENRMEYRRGDLTEWYVNGSQGLEQGFTFARRPPKRGSGPLTIALGVTGGRASEQKDGAVLLGNAFRYSGLTARDARGADLPSRIEVRGDEIRLIVEDTEAQYPLAIDPTWTQQTELTAEDGSTGDEFGYSVAISGTTGVIGVENYNSATGRAYVFVRSGSTWTQQAQLTATDGLVLDFFGCATAISGDTAVIGAFQHPVNRDGAGPGAAYVFTRSGSIWTQQAELTPEDGSAGDEFGNAVAMDGATVFVGALNHKVGMNFGQGAAYVFVQSDGVWNQQAEMMPEDGSAGDEFGNAVAMDGATVVVGAKNHQVGTKSGEGAAYVFVQSDGVWSQQAELMPGDGVSGDNFGVSASILGGTAVIGSYYHPNDAENDINGPGAAYVFVQNGSTWSEQSELTPHDGLAGDTFGQAVSLSGNAVLVGAPAHPNDPFYGNGPGAAYLFVQNGSTWSQQTELTSDDYLGSDLFGFAVALSGGTALIGAPTGYNYQGSVYPFQLPSSLSIGATHSSPVFQSGPGTIILTVANTGGPTVDTATISDTIDSGLTINSTSPGCSASGQVVTCTLPPNTVLASNESDVYVTAGASAAGSISNTATLTDPTDTVASGSSTDPIAVTAQSPQVDSSLAQLVLSGSTDNGTCASGSRTLTATDQLHNTTGATLTNPYAVIQTLSGGNTLLSQSADSSSVASGAYVTFTFHIQLATCNPFQLLFDVRGN